jgi:hypothetical protein
MAGDSGKKCFWGFGTSPVNGDGIILNYRMSVKGIPILCNFFKLPFCQMKVSFFSDLALKDLFCSSTSVSPGFGQKGLSE